MYSLGEKCMNPNTVVIGILEGNKVCDKCLKIENDISKG